MNLNEFNEFYLNNLLDKLSKENKTVFLLGDFNINFLNYDQDTSSNEFLDSLSSHLLLPHILQPKRVRRNSKTPIDNIFSNAISSNIIPDNITSSISLKNAAIKLNKAKAVLTKIRHRVDMKTLKSIYHAIFELHLCYAALVWTYNLSSDRRLYCQYRSKLRVK